MTPLGLLAVAVAGGLGAVARLIVDRAVTSRFRGVFPLGTFVVNVSGSFAIGVVSALVAGSAVPGATATVLATGLLGGYTTFSAASVDAMRLAREGKPRAAALSAAALLVSSTLAAALGLAVSLGILSAF